ncbi:MAG TPA: flagellar basal body rod protein FlgC [Chloroflexota bacterium]|jgi:flagellar basal-body rod protein FlgC|nr:flagellar basal body rod protein FlgC [Chloroflexota bacterium]
MSFLDSMQINASGLTAQRLRLDVISSNLANINTTRTAEGGPYRREQAVFSPIGNQYSFRDVVLGLVAQPSPTLGVRVSEIQQDNSEGRLVYDPEHPDADANGYVHYPNVNPVTEMTDLISAQRGYEANITAMNTTKAMAMKAIDLAR